MLDVSERVQTLTEIEIGNKYFIYNVIYNITNISYITLICNFIFIFLQNYFILFSIPSESICQMSKIKKLLKKP